MKKLAAVIIEDRKITDFYRIVKEHMKYLPKDTDIIVYTSESTEKEYKKLLKDDNIYFRRYTSNLPIPKTMVNIAGFDELMKSNDRMKPLLNYCLFTTSSVQMNKNAMPFQIRRVFVCLPCLTVFLCNFFKIYHQN
jgi:hypothetical protein